MKTKDIYIVYCGEDIPYEPRYAHCAFEDYDEAAKFCKTCNEQEEEQNKRYNEAVSILDKWDTWLEQHDMTPTWECDELDDAVVEAISKEFNVSPEDVRKTYADSEGYPTSLHYSVVKNPMMLYVKS